MTILLLWVLLLKLHLRPKLRLWSNWTLVNRDGVSWTANRRLFLYHLGACWPHWIGSHRSCVSRMRLVLLEVWTHVMHASNFSWLQRDAIIVHNHLRFQRRVDQMSVGLAHTCILRAYLKHLLRGSLETGMHVVNLTIRSDSSLGCNFLFVHELSATRCDRPLPRRCLLIGLPWLIDSLLEWASSSHVGVVDVGFILSLTGKLVSVVPAELLRILLIQNGVRILTYCLLDIVVVLWLREVARTWLLSVLFGCQLLRLRLGVNRLILVHALHILCNYLVFVHHWLWGVGVVEWHLGTCLTCNCALFAAQAIVLVLTALWVILFHVSVEGILLTRLYDTNVILWRIIDMADGVFVEALVWFGHHALTLTRLRHHLFLGHFDWLLRLLLRLSLALNIINEDSIRLIENALLRTLRCHLIRKTAGGVLFSTYWPHLVVFSVKSSANPWLLSSIPWVLGLVLLLVYDVLLKLRVVFTLSLLDHYLLLTCLRRLTVVGVLHLRLLV